MRFGEQVSGQRSEAAKTVRHEHAILLSASSSYCAQFPRYVKAVSSPQLHKSTVSVLGEVLKATAIRILICFCQSAADHIVTFRAFRFVGEKEKAGCLLLDLNRK
jgi:hypothetical protein